MENVQAILAEIEEEYPEGTRWAASSTENPGNYYKDDPGYDNTRDVRAAMNKFGPINLQYACGGWMCMVSERIFGKTGAPAHEITDITKARPGDIVIKMNSKGNGIAHVCIFQKYEPAYTAYGFNYSATMYTCDGNVGGQVDWMGSTQLDDDLSDLRNTYGQKIYILTRYPD